MITGRSFNTAMTLTSLVDRVESLGVLPHVVFKVLEISAGEDGAAIDLEKVITVDPGFSSKVLVLANSAGFGLPRRVTSIREAVMFLGSKNLRSLALTAGAYDLFVGKTDKESLRRRAWWRHSIDTAVGSRWLAGKTGRLSPEEGYTCGLLHLIGKTLMDRYAGRDYEDVMQVQELGIPDYIAERDVYGYDHAQVGSEAAAKWGLPETLQSAMKYLDAPSPEDIAADHRACLAVGSALAKRARGEHAEIPGWASEWLVHTGLPTDALLEGSIEAITTTELTL